MNKRVAVLGYGSWIMAERNPPQMIVETLQADPPEGVELIARSVPVDGAALAEAIDAVLGQKPDALIGIGLAAGAPAVRLETTAINTRDYRVPDAAGACPCDEPILDDGPAAYRSDLNNAQIVEALCAAQIPAQLSHAAGTHCCNQMLYLARHQVTQQGLATRCGFLHVPYTHWHMARLKRGEQMQPSMALSTLAKAAQIAIQHG